MLVSYKEQGVGAGILDYFPVLNMLPILELPAFRASLYRSVCREMRESSTDNVFITFNMHLRVLATLLKNWSQVQHSPRGPPIPLPPCQIFYYRFSLLVSKHCFFSNLLPLSLPRKSMHNQDDGFTLPVQQFCCIHSLSTAIYSWDNRQVWRMD